MRLFVAIEIDQEIRNRIAEFIAQLKPRVANARWVRPEGLHITLKFLGNVTEEKVLPIERALQPIQAAKFPITVQNVGIFPSPKSPRVLWLGIDAGLELVHLAERVDEKMSSCGFEREKRPFSPHVTLARLAERGKKPDLNFLVSGPKPTFGTMMAKHFHLYESKLGPQGSRYSKLATFALS